MITFDLKCFFTIYAFEADVLRCCKLWNGFFQTTICCSSNFSILKIKCL